MKKIIAMLLAIVMVCALSVSAFADTQNNLTDNTTSDVKGTYNQSAHAETAYVIEITWGAMQCTYNVDTKYWDTDTHTWENPAEGAYWSYSGNTIKVVNNSSVGITVTPAFDAEDAYNGITGSFTGLDEEKAYATAAQPAGGVETEVNLTLTLEGELAEGTNNAVIGSITLTLADVVPAA